MGRGTKQKRKAARAEAQINDAPARVSQAEVVMPEERLDDATPLLPPAMEQWLQQNGAVLGICLFLVAATLAVYGQTVGFDFVTYDDNIYVYENLHVMKGLTFEGIQWAFTHVHAANWHPLTTISHMLDWSLYGKWSGGHHLTNVLLHALASVILFLALRRMTGAVWRSGIVAAFFCLHPLHVESVAWVSERKDVLSAVFFGLTLWAYAVYADDTRRVPAAFPWGRYGLVLLLFTLGLLSKPMLVTLPFLLMLLDYWPLRRWDVTEHQDAEGKVIKSRPRYANMFLEKLPMLALTVAASIATYAVQSSAGAVTETVEPIMRLQTAIVGYGRYLVMLVWPFNLSMRYTPDQHLNIQMIAVCMAVIAIVTALAWLWSRRGGRYALVGWLWFLGMIVPVSGIVVIGEQSMADRYSYLTYTGLFIVLVWGAADLGAGRLGGWVAGILLALWAGLSMVQASVWRDSESLYRQALAVQKDSFVAHSNLGKALENAGKLEEAEKEYRISLQIQPRDFQAHNSLGVMERRRGNLQAAKDHYLAALSAKPDYALAHNNLAVAYADMGLLAEAEQECRLALKFDPDLADAERNLGKSYAAKKQWQEAIAHYRRAIDLEPNRAGDHLSIGIALLSQGSLEEGIAACKKAIELDPESIEAHNKLAGALYSAGRLEDALKEWAEVLKLRPLDPEAAKGVGMISVKMRYGANAIPFLQAVVTADPHDLEARSFKAQAHVLVGQFAEATAEYREILRQDPKNVPAAKGLGAMLIQSGHGAEAVAPLQTALEASPADIETRQFMVYARLAAKQIPEAMSEFRKVLHQDPKNRAILAGLTQIVAQMPKNASVRGFRANVLIETKQIEAALPEFREVLKLDPKNLDALNSLAWIEATHPDAKLRNAKEAVAYAEKAAELHKDDALTLDTLAAAYAAAERFKDAMATARKAKEGAEKIKARALAKSIDDRLKLYEAGKPYRDTSMTGK